MFSTENKTEKEVIYKFLKHFLKITISTHSKEGHGGAAWESPIGNVGLLGKVGSTFNRSNHAFDSQESGQVGRVRTDDDEREKPPDPTDDAGRSGLKMFYGYNL